MTMTLQSAAVVRDTAREALGDALGGVLRLVFTHTEVYTEPSPDLGPRSADADGRPGLVNLDREPFGSGAGQLDCALTAGATLTLDESAAPALTVTAEFPIDGITPAWAGDACAVTAPAGLVTLTDALGDAVPSPAVDDATADTDAAPPAPPKTVRDRVEQRAVELLRAVPPFVVVDRFDAEGTPDKLATRGAAVVTVELGAESNADQSANSSDDGPYGETRNIADLHVDVAFRHDPRDPLSTAERHNLLLALVHNTLLADNAFLEPGATSRVAKDSAYAGSTADVIDETRNTLNFEARFLVWMQHDRTDITNPSGLTQTTH